MPHFHFRTTILLIFLIFLLAIPALFSCQKKHTPWDAGSPESNRLMLQFDSVCSFSRQYRDSTTMKALATSMEILGRADSLSKARWYFMKQYIAKINQNNSLTLLYNRQGRAMLDSAKYPYETARFIYDISYYGKTASEKYMRVAGPLRVFEEYGDSVRMASSYGSLGALHSLLHDNESALDYSVKSRDIYNRLGEKQSSYRLSGNIALMLRDLGRRDEAFRLNDSMRRDPWFGNDKAVDCLVLSNIYDSTRNVHLLRQGLEIAKTLTKKIDEPLTPVPFISAKLGRYYLKEGRLDSAECFASPVLRALDDGRNTYDDMYLFKAELAEARGDSATGKATRTLLAAMQSEERKAGQIADTENKPELERVKNFNARLDSETKRMSATAIVLICLAVVLASAAVWVTARCVRRRSESRISELSDDLSRSSSELTVAHLKNAEQERVLPQALEDAHGINKGTSDARATSSKIAADISRAADSKSDWEKFEITFTNSNPGFVAALRERTPALTKGDMRLSCMIAMGMDSKHIARVLAINVDSVKKNRQRLRAKLKLDADTTLPEFLASLMQG